MDEDDISPDQVRERWVYSELLSGRYGEGSEIESLVQKAREQVPFTDLGTEERKLLRRRWPERRGGAAIFEHFFTNIRTFHLTHWRAGELAQVLIIPYFAQDVLSPSLAFHAGMTVPFGTWIETEPIRPLPGGHARFAANEPPPSGEMEPLTVGLNARSELVLLDGYHRAVRFWHRRIMEPANTLPVFVPGKPQAP
jgi:hypothetical protein